VTKGLFYDRSTKKKKKKKEEQGGKILRRPLNFGPLDLEPKWQTIIDQAQSRY
jgi:hypothetical protein